MIYTMLNDILKKPNTRWRWAAGRRRSWSSNAWTVTVGPRWGVDEGKGRVGSQEPHRFFYKGVEQTREKTTNNLHRCDEYGYFSGLF